jgi:hypothetical protein
VWGRQQFAGSFARGGAAATLFAPSRAEAFISPWRMKAGVGGGRYLENLRRLQKLHPDNPKIQKTISKTLKSGGPKVGPSLLGGGLMAAMIALPAFTTEGPIEEKMRAVTSGAGSFAGWEVGSKLGMGIGAAVGGGIGGVVGYIGGGLIGSIAGGELTEAITRIPDRMVDRERNRRNLDWGAHTAAFQTQRAHTMRQQSLAAMNRGQMSARSLLGQESMFVHR